MSQSWQLWPFCSVPRGHCSTASCRASVGRASLEGSRALWPAVAGTHWISRVKLLSIPPAKQHAPVRPQPLCTKLPSVSSAAAHAWAAAG